MSIDVFIVSHPSINVNAYAMLTGMTTSSAPRPAGTRSAAVRPRAPARSGDAARTGAFGRTSSPTGGFLPIADLAGCCRPVTGDDILDEESAERLAAVLKALAEPTRLRLVSLIASGGRAEACVCELTEPVGLSQPTVSHHLRVLVDAGLLEREQRGRWAYYRLVPGALGALAEVFGADGSAPRA